MDAPKHALVDLNLARKVTLVDGDDKEIIPGHDARIFSLFPKIADGVVKIE